MEVLNEQQYPLVKLVLEQALEPGLARAQVLELQTQALVQVAELARLEPQVQALLEPQAQVLLELEQHLQWSHPKPQLHHHRCKVPDRRREPQLELLQTQVHPKALDMTPRVLVLALERAAQLAQELEQPA